MIAFILSIRHPANAHSYDKVEALLERTIASLTNSASDDYRIVVVGNKAPESFELHPKVDFVAVDFPPPSDALGSGIPLDAFRRDKGTKCLIGVIRAMSFNPDHFMLVDADDYVHRDLVGYCSDRKSENGWVIEDGYIYADGGAIIADFADFNHFCGTCNIVHRKLIEPFIDPSLDTASSQDDVLEKTDDYFLRFILGAHRPVPEFFEKRGAPLAPFPFPAAIWVTNTGENHSGAKLIGEPRLLTEKHREEFAIAPVSDAVQRRASLVGLPAYRAKHFIRTKLLGRK